MLAVSKWAVCRYRTARGDLLCAACRSLHDDDDLEAAPPQMLSWEESEDSGSCSLTEREVIRRPVSPRYPRRERRPTRRLQMDACNKEYDERASWASDNSYSSDYDSD